MPKALPVDYTKARDLYLQGVPSVVIAQQLGIPIDTLKARITRGKWVAARQDVSAELPERGAKWRNRIATLVNRLTDAAIAMPDARLRKLARPDVQSIRDLVSMGMQAYGLDQAGSGPTVQIAVYNKGGYTKVGTDEKPHSPSMDSQSSQVIDA
jgi:hypothetical protein